MFPTTHLSHIWPKVFRAHTGPGKPGKSWNFIMAFSKTRKSCKRPLVLESSGNLLNSTKNMKCMEGSKENNIEILGV